MQRLQGYAEKGGYTVIKDSSLNTRTVQGSFPLCTVTVYLAGTTTIASIYSNNLSTPTVKANPFTADADGGWFFYAADGKYDVRFSGTGITVPFTLGDFVLYDHKSLVLNPTDWPYLATGDGTADDTAAISAVASAASDGDIIDLAGKNYLIKSQVLFTGKSITFRHGTLTFHNIDQGGQLGSKTGGAGKILTFEYVNFLGTPTRQNNSGGVDNLNYWFIFRYFTQVNFLHCTFTNTGTTTNPKPSQYFGSTEYVDETNIDHCYFYQIDSDGFNVVGSSDPLVPAGIARITDSRFSQTSAITHGGSGISAQALKQIIFTGNYTSNQTTYSAHNLQGESVIIDDNHFINCDKGFDFSIGANVPYSLKQALSYVITNNEFVNCTNGIVSYAEDATGNTQTWYCALHTVIENNTFDSNVSGGYGISIFPGSSLKISKNTFRNGMCAIRLDYWDSGTTDENGDAHTPVLSHYDLDISGNTFDKVGSAGGSYTCPILLKGTDRNPSVFSINIQDNNSNMYSSGALSTFIFLALYTSNVGTIVTLKGNRYDNLWSLIVPVSDATFNGVYNFIEEAYRTSLTSAKLIDFNNGYAPAQTPDNVIFDGCRIWFSGASQQLMTSNLSTGGLTKFSVVNCEFHLMPGYTDVGNISPILSNLSQAAEYSPIIANNRFFNESGSATIGVAINLTQPLSAMITDNLIVGMFRGINVGYIMEIFCISNTVINANDKAYIFGPGAGVSGAGANGLIIDNIAYDGRVAPQMTYGIWSNNGTASKLFYRGNFVKGAITAPFYYNNLPVSQVLDEITDTDAVPTLATDPGHVGQIAWDSGHLYVCIATNTWVRAALATWP